MYDAPTSQYEALCELAPGHYVEYSAIDAGYYGHDEDGNEKRLPPGARSIMRWFEGSFVVFAKASTYNADKSTDDGRHAAMTVDEFREHIRRRSLRP